MDSSRDGPCRVDHDRQMARARLRGFGQQVRIEFADTDQYGRTVGKVWIGGTDANLEQVKRGMKGLDGDGRPCESLCQ